MKRTVMRRPVAKWTVLCALALLTMAWPVWAQSSGTVTGLVTNALTNEPMPGLLVVVESTNLSR